VSRSVKRLCCKQKQHHLWCYLKLVFKKITSVACVTGTGLCNCSKCEKDSNDGAQLSKIYIKLISNDKNNTKFNISLTLRLKITKLSQRNPLIKMCKIYTLNCTSIFAHFYSIHSLVVFSSDLGVTRICSRWYHNI
jgi:hypothetical protein